MNRIPAWDGSAEKWTEYENEVLSFEQSLKPSERPQLVARLFKVLSGPGKKAIQSESAKTFAGKDAEQYLEFLLQNVGIHPNPVILGTNWITTSSDSNDRRRKPWLSGGSDGVYQRLLSALERAIGRKNKTSVHDSLTQTKRGEPVEEFQNIDDSEDTSSIITAGSRPWSTQEGSLQSGRTGRSQRVLDECGTMHIPRLHLAPTDPHDVPDRFLPPHVRGWLLLRNSRLGLQERANTVSHVRRHQLQQSIPEVAFTVERC